MEAAPVSETFYHCTDSLDRWPLCYIDNTPSHRSLDLNIFHLTVSQLQIMKHFGLSEK